MRNCSEGSPPSEDVATVATEAEEPFVLGINPATILKGEPWVVHKFGGTCLGSADRIQNVASVLVNDPSPRKVVVVSAMAGVTDMMYDLLKKAESQKGSFVTALDNVFEKHKAAALSLLDEGVELDTFLKNLSTGVHKIKSVLEAISIGMLSFFGGILSSELCGTLFLSCNNWYTSYSCNGYRSWVCFGAVLCLCCGAW